MPNPASARPAATAAATARWVSPRGGSRRQLRGVEGPAGQLVVEQHPGAGSALPVDVTHAGPGQVLDAGQAERVAGGHDQALLAGAPAGSRRPRRCPAPGRRGAACTRRSPGRAGASRPGGTDRRAARPGRPASPTFEDARVSRGSRSRSAEAARSSTRSCEPIATIVRVTSSRPRSSSTSTSSPAWWPSRPAGTTSSPSARTSEVRTPAPRGSGVATTCPADPTQPHPYPVVRCPRVDASLRASRAVRGAPSGRRGALQLGQQRGREDVEGQRCRHRVAGCAQHRGARRRRPAPPGARDAPRPRARPAGRPRRPPGRSSRRGRRWTRRPRPRGRPGRGGLPHRRR